MDKSKEDFMTKIFTGMDEGDLNRKVWEWQTKNLVTIIETLDVRNQDQTILCAWHNRSNNTHGADPDQKYQKRLCAY